MTPEPFTATALWREAARMPASLATTVDRLGAETDLVRLYRRPEVRRIVATGNGAAYYVALALQVASLAQPAEAVDVVAIPAGMLSSRDFTWRHGDRLLAISSSGEMSDVIEAVDRDAPGEFGAITATPGSTIGRSASAIAHVAVEAQDSPTHTQAYAGNLTAALDLWARLSSDHSMLDSIRGIPAAMETAVSDALPWADQHVARVAGATGAATVFGSGPAWPAALEAALLLKEVAAVPAEGMETREGATSGMYALDDQSLVISIGSHRRDAAITAAERSCRSRGASVVSIRATDTDPRLVALVTFPAAVALAGMLGVERGLDIDHPAWLDAYYASARVDPEGDDPA